MTGGEFNEKDLQEMKKYIRSVEPGFCPSCWMILDFRCTKDMVNESEHFYRYVLSVSFR